MNSNTLPPAANLRQHHLDRIQAESRAIQELTGRCGWLSRARGIVFLCAAVLAFAGWAEWAPPGIMFSLAILVFFGFVWVVGYHEHVADLRHTAERRCDLQRRQLGRLDRDWDNVPHIKVAIAEASQSVAKDLDLFSRGGLYHLINRTHTPAGRTTLRDWILTGASPEVIRQRQSAVQRLRGERTFCDKLDLHGSLLASSDAGPVAFTQWATSRDWFENRRFILWGMRFLAATGIGLLALILLGFLPGSAIYGLIGLVCFNVVINGIFIGGVHDIFNQITAGRNEIRHYAALLELIDGMPDDPDLLGQLQTDMHSGNTSFRQALARLQRIMRLAAGRRSALWFLPYIVAQLLIYWDFDILHRLEHWKRIHGASVPRWFSSLAQIEALASLATLAADHPDWSFPDVDANNERFVAKQLGHPLLPRDDVRCNDVALGPSGSFLLVTGSNMSGKSTLLRSLGVNAVLAQAGGPVCAQALEIPPLQIATSMRVSDSLHDGVSFFFAELKRLKQIVDQSRSMQSQSGTRLLFLLDEILQGTNSRERQIAVAQVIEHLLMQPTLGAVSTHDLELATASALKDRCDTVHFREHFTGEAGNREMHFDYVLRNGVSPTTNALALLEMVGLGK